MATDAAPSLAEKMHVEFCAAIESSKKIQEFQKKAEKGTATQTELSEYAGELGGLIGRVIKNNLNSETLPGGVLYWNIAERTMMPLFREMHDLIAEAVVNVLTSQYRKQKVGIKAVAPEFPEERYRRAISSMADASRYEDMTYE